MKPALVSRADLLRALTWAEPAEQARIAALLGFELVDKPHRPARQQQQPEIVTVAEASEIAPAILRSTPFWQPRHFAVRPTDQQRAPIEKLKPRNPGEAPVFQLLAPWHELLPRLRRLLTTSQESGDIDVDRVVGALSHGRYLDRLPLETRRRWPATLDVIVDRSDRLTPYWKDQDLLTQALYGALAHTSLRRARIDETLAAPEWLDGGEAYAPPQPGGVVLVLGDLGCLDRSPHTLDETWRSLAYHILAAGGRPVALIPGPLSRCPPDLRQLWNAAPWETSGSDLSQDRTSCSERADRLLGLLSSCVRIEPGLLRAVRRCLPPTLADAGTEADVWQHAAIESTHCDGASLRQKTAAPLAAHCLQQDTDTQLRVLEHRRRWRHALPDEIWYLEVIGLPEPARALLPGEFDAACTFFRAINNDPVQVTERLDRIDAWLEEAQRRVAIPALRVSAFAEVVGKAAQRRGREQDIPPIVDPRSLASGAEKMLRLWQRGHGLMLLDDHAPLPEAGSLLGLLRSGNGRAQIIAIQTKPDWAHDGGHDDFGPWASFTVTGADGKPVTQRLRWIPPGRFQMGSPPDEWGHSKGVGPQHEVTLAQGFWLFDTPCTLALWQAVMSNNPTDREGARHPVGTVSFDDAHRFMERLNRLVPTLDLSLPSEAQWEYACRAGTTTATYAGDLGEDQPRTREVLDPIAWYDANSGNETHPVAIKRPNPWGLYDMLGNVWEWCADHWHDDYTRAPVDGSAWLDPSGGSAHRVVRGGSWLYDARHARAAYRGRDGPAARNDGLGFRCARVVQANSERNVATGGADPASRHSAERDRPPGATSPATALRVSEPAPLPTALGPSLLIRTDREELWVDTLAVPPRWATGGLGRDRFGLFAEIIMPNADVSQRLRWIPPGRFIRGSSESEAGRWDDKGPEREVTMADGFWLFDTPCTQALWRAVTREDPSAFKGPTRPVENVSFPDVEAFLLRINERVPGLNLSLPSEAQWEYACRAGTTTATYAGDLGEDQPRTREVLDPIAWHDANSGNETHPVATKRPNPWGLYDMLGNVWEWCADHWHDDYTRAPVDGSAWLDPSGGSAPRVVRGGSWFVDARVARVAFRDHYEPADRFDGLGFRCARVQRSEAISESPTRVGLSERSERSEQAAKPRPRRGRLDVLWRRKSNRA